MWRALRLSFASVVEVGPGDLSALNHYHRPRWLYCPVWEAVSSRTSAEARVTVAPCSMHPIGVPPAADDAGPHCITRTRRGHTSQSNKRMTYETERNCGKQILQACCPVFSPSSQQAALAMNIRHGLCQGVCGRGLV